MTQRNKGRPGRGAWVLAAFALLLLPRPASQAAEDRHRAKEITDKYATVGGAINPAVGVVFKVFGEFYDWAINFGRSEPDALAEAVKIINARLDALEARMTAVEDAVQKVQNDVFRNANLQRVRQLRAHRQVLLEVLVRLQQQPKDKDTRVVLAQKAGAIAEEFRADPDLWLWSDLVLADTAWSDRAVKAGQLLEPDFKPFPTMGYYTLALATWMTAVEYAADGDKAWIQRTYGDEIQKHIDFLSVRPGWDRVKDDPATLPENVRKRVTGLFEPDKYPENMVCHFHEYTVDTIARQVKYVQTIGYPAQQDNELCTVPQGFWNHTTDAEEALEREHGMGLMWALAQDLVRLKTYGTVREAFVGTFPLGSTAAPAFLYGVRPDGRLAWYRHDSARLDPGPGKPEAWKAGSPSGSGWDGFREVIPGGRNVIYAVTRDGKLFWYRHNGFNIGEPKDWEGGKEIAGGGWADFRHVFSGGPGVLYGITGAGNLVWYRHTGYATGARTWEGGKDVSPEGEREPPAPPGEVRARPRKPRVNWADFTRVFSGGDGIIYAVTLNGKLLWYRHLGSANGERAWEGPREVGGSGWGDYQKLFGAGDGLIYAITRAGKLVRYRHTGYSTGARTWEPGREVAGGWGDFSQALALLPDSVSDIPR